MKRNALVTLLLSQGVPMLSAGDELGRTQQGNNNAYCQNSPLSWIDWNPGESAHELHNFLKGLAHFFHQHPSLRRKSYFPETSAGQPHLRWLRSDGQPFTQNDWGNPWIKSLAMLMNGDVFNEIDDKGHLLKDDTLLLLFHAGDTEQPFFLPAHNEAQTWELVLDTRYPRLLEPRPQHAINTLYNTEPRSVALFRLQ